MTRRKKSDGGLGLVLILGLIIVLAAIPRQIWIAVAVIGGIWLTYRIYKHFAPKPTSLLIEPMVEELSRSAVPEPSPEKRRRALEVAKRAQEARAKAASTPAVPRSVWQTDAEASSGIQPASVPRVAAPPVPPVSVPIRGSTQGGSVDGRPRRTRRRRRQPFRSDGLHPTPLRACRRRHNA